MIVVKKWQNHYWGIVYSGMMLMAEHCSSIHFRSKTTVLAFTLSVTVTLLLTDLTSAPDDKCIGIEYCQKYVKEYRRYPYWYCIQKVSLNAILTTLAVAQFSILVSRERTVANYSILFACLYNFVQKQNFILQHDKSNCLHLILMNYSVSEKKVAPPLKLFAIYSLRLSIFPWNFAGMFSVHIYTYLPILVDLS